MAFSLPRKRMAQFEAYIDEATTSGPNQIIPSCAAVVVDKDGIIYSKCSGSQSVDPDSTLFDIPMSLDATMWIASCTKLMTAIAVLQCVERGLLDLEADVSMILPEFRNTEILLGFEKENGKPIVKKATKKITLRMFLNHSSGLCLQGMDPRLVQYRKYQGKWPPRSTTSLYDNAFLPLLYEPGTSWSYGNGLEWAGQMVERVHNNQPLGEYMKANIWDPLEMTSTTFRLTQRPDMRSRLVDMTFRQSKSNTLVKSRNLFWSEKTPEDYGGAGVYSCPRDYVKLLSAILRNDGTLLRSESVDMLFATPSLNEDCRVALREFIHSNPRPMPQYGHFPLLLTAGLPSSISLDYALGGLVVLEDVRSDDGSRLRRRKGTMTWGGLPNLQWVIDREAGIGLLYATQLIPPGDVTAADAFRRFEEAVQGKEALLEKL